MKVIAVHWFADHENALSLTNLMEYKWVNHILLKRLLNSLI